jgi:hypothetical protein
VAATADSTFEWRKEGAHVSPSPVTMERYEQTTAAH